jgi:RNA-directed DNA polymerase
VAGTPQRSPISPLLATVALHVLDEEWSARHGGLGALVGYCDDLVVLCASGARAEEARSRPAAIVAPLGLRLNPDKTRIVCLTEGREGFDVLGFHHRTRRSRRRPGVWYLASWPSARAMRSLRAKPREATGRRNVGRPVGAVVAYLNRVRRGWGNFFRWGNPAKKFWNIDRYVYERLERFLRAKHGPRFGRRRTYDIYPRPGVYRPDENDPRPPCACLTINDVGKPCDREAHARFDGGREEPGASRLAARHRRLPPTRPTGVPCGSPRAG